LKNLGYVTEEEFLEFENDKEKRNIRIGQLVTNPLLNQFLISSTEALVNEFLNSNKIKEDDIILRNKDSVIINKLVDNQNSNLTLRKVLNCIIFTINRKSYLLFYKDDGVERKGYLTEKELLDESVYLLLKQVQYYNTKTLYSSIEKIRKIVYRRTNKSWFIVRDKIKKKLYVPLKNDTFLEIPNEKMIEEIATNSFDPNYIWEQHIWPFIESILFEHFNESKNIRNR